MLFGELSVKLAVAHSKICFAANTTALIRSPETKRRTAEARSMMQTAEIQQTPTTVFDGLVGNDEAEGGTYWSSRCMLEGLNQGLLLTGTLTGPAHLTSSNSTTVSHYH